MLVTRAAHQASELADRLRALGATPILIPTIEIAPPSSYAPLDAALCELATFDCVAFTSANAVQSFHARALLIGISPQIGCVASVGKAIDFILQRRSIPRTNLIGWSWGTAIMAKYATQNSPKNNAS